MTLPAIVIGGVILLMLGLAAGVVLVVWLAGTGRLSR